MTSNHKGEQLTEQIEKQKKQVIESWDTALYTQYERGKLWYLIAILTSILTISLSLFFGSKTFALLIFAISLVYLLFAKQEVPHVKCEVSRRGIQFGNKFYPYEKIDSFWIEEHLPTFQALHLELKKNRIKDVEIQFYDFKKEYLINILQRFIPYDKNKHSSLLDHLVHVLKL